MKDNGILPNCVEYARAQEEIERHWKEKHANGEKMKATTNINKEEFLEKIDKAKKLLDEAPKTDRQYLINENLLNQIFEIATKAIPVSWIEAKIDNTPICSEQGMYWSELLEDWNEENMRAMGRQKEYETD